MTEFKDTMMGKMTYNAIKSWGEEDASGNWFAPTDEQAYQMLTEEGYVTEDGKKISYSDAKVATDSKTYGSEIAGIEAIADLVVRIEDKGLQGEELESERTALIEMLKGQVYTQEKMTPELATRIQSAMEKNGGVEKSTIEILGNIHDGWVKGNGKKFVDPKRQNKLYQFADLRMMTFGDDGALADLIFVEPVLNGAGIEVDRGNLRREFNRQQYEYMDKQGIKSYSDIEGIKEYLKKLPEVYTPVTEAKIAKDSERVVADELTPERIESMASQIRDNINKDKINAKDIEIVAEQGKESDFKKLGEEYKESLENEKQEMNNLNKENKGEDYAK